MFLKCTARGAERGACLCASHVKATSLHEKEEYLVLRSAIILYFERKKSQTVTQCAPEGAY